MNLPFAIERLIEEFTRLPGIGVKTAQRLAFFVIEADDEILNLSEAIVRAKREIKYCNICYNFSEEDLCPICKSQKRDQSTICVVEEPKDILSIEKTKEYNGLYHVLHGAISPLEGIGPEDIKIRELITRLADSNIEEIIVATNPTIEGEATSVYLSKLISQFDILVTRIAHGIPVGSGIEYADEITMTKALEGRRKLR
ncbi:MAG: recombination mediator RecR [Firmicutes bacterium]|jgi:recombination protein RecR|nr:recombination mediator RecR [Bacillota bacterium]